MANFYVRVLKNTIQAGILLMVLSASFCYAGTSDLSQTEKRQAPQFLGGYHHLFTPNRGQLVDMKGHLCPDVLYRGNGGGADIFLRKTGISYVYTTMNNKLQNTENIDKQSSSAKWKESSTLYRVDMDFAGCNSNIITENEDSAEGYNNYYFAHCPDGILNVRQYSKVVFRNVYDNVDVVYHGSGGQTFKYDIVVKPDADVARIKLRWKGEKEMYINSSGSLVIKTDGNEFYESIPKVYQEINGKTVLVEAQYNLESLSSSDNGRIVTFRIGNYNHGYPLVIDPLTWITYFGGNMEDFGASVVTDGQHNAIFEGYTESPNLPVSPGAFQTTLDGFSDGFVAKFSSAGTRLWATYIGGSAKDEARGGIAVDAHNDIFISSVTWSTDFPVKAWGGAFMQVVNNSPNNGTAYVAQFSPAGALLWATYYGGSVADWGSDITLDKAGNIIFTGQTSSSDFPVLAAYQPTLKGATNAFIVKFNNLGVRQWATYYGGSGTDQSWGITTDAASNIYVCGKTTSANFPTVAAYQAAYAGGADDAFLVKLNTANGNPIWSTYYGGSGDDWGTSVAMDTSGNVFLGLYTSSPNNISTAGSYQPAFAGGASDGGIVKFTSSGGRVWGTYMGGNQADLVTGLAIDANNNISVTGTTSSADFPVTSCAFETVYKGGADMTVSKFSQQQQLLCSTFIDNSSTGPLAGGSVAVDGPYVYINGNSEGGLPATPGAFQSVYGGTGNLGDAAFVKLCSYSCDTAGGVSVLANFSATPAAPCLGQLANFNLSNTSCDTANTAYSWNFAGATPATSTMKNPNGIIWNSSGTYSVSVKITSPCDSTTISKTIMVSPAPIPVIKGESVKCEGISDTLTVSGGNTYIWSNGNTTTTYASGNIEADSTIYVTVENSLGCAVTDSFKITVALPPTVSVTSGIICLGQCTTLTATASGSGNTYSWSNGGTSSNDTVCPLSTTSYTVTVSNGCVAQAIANVKVYTPSSFYACCDTTIKEGDTAHLKASSDSIYKWTPSTGLNCDTCKNVFATPMVTTTYTITGTNSYGCKDERTVTVFVTTECFNFIVPNVFTPNGDEINDQFVIPATGFDEYSISIYDRWGIEVYKSSDPTKYWNGNTESGGKAPEGVYYYIINASCAGNSYKKDGFVQLIR